MRECVRPSMENVWLEESTRLEVVSKIICCEMSVYSQQMEGDGKKDG